MTPRAEIPTVTLADGLALPVLGLGVIGLDPAQAEAAVSAALLAGYRLIDTAAVDGNEEAVGRAIAGSGVPRDELRIITRLATEDQGFQGAQDGCRASLARLGLDYVDVYLLDWPAEQGRYIDAWAGAMKARDDGNTKSIGVSNFGSEALTDLIDLTYVAPAINQVELHPLLNQAELRAIHAEHSIVTGAYGPLGDGALLDHPVIATVAAAHGKSAAQVLIRWSIQLGNVVTPRTADPASIAENLAVFDFELTEADMATLDGLDDGTLFHPSPA
jgi:diketogulonate reductase-like aldo/keto reductase